MIYKPSFIIIITMSRNQDGYPWASSLSLFASDRSSGWIPDRHRPVVCRFVWKKNKLYGNYTRMLRVLLSETWREHPTKQQPYGHQPPIKKIIQVRRTRHAGPCCRSRDELISYVFLWTPSQGQAKSGRPAKTSKPSLSNINFEYGCHILKKLLKLDMPIHPHTRAKYFPF